MLNNIVPETAAPVNPEYPIRYTQGGRVWWISVTRTCGHTDQIPDDSSVHGAEDFASRDDIKCGKCRQADHAAAPHIPAPRPTRSTHGSRTGGSSDSRPSRSTGTRQRRPNRDDKINDATFWFNNATDFLEAVAAGQIHASSYSIAYATNMRATALRTLRQLGAVV